MVILTDDKCPNCYSRMREQRGGVGQFRVMGHTCDRCGYTAKVRNDYGHRSERTEYPGYSHACGYSD